MKKISWPVGIVIVFVLFAGLMVTFAVMASQNKMSLVVKDYYRAEIEFQKQIDKKSNLNNLPVRPSFSLNKETKSLDINFPSVFRGTEMHGEILLYRPDNAGLDKRIALNPDPQGLQAVPLEAMQTGRWKLKLDWVSNDVPFYMEETLNIP